MATIKKIILLTLTSLMMVGCGDVMRSDKDIDYLVVLASGDSLHISACFWYYSNGCCRFERTDGALTELSNVKHIIAKEKEK